MPMEDVGSIIISSFSARFHGHLFLEAARKGVSVILCDAFRPASLLLPANRATDTRLSRALLGLPEALRTRLWQKTVDAKCRNQASLAAAIAPGDSALAPLAALAESRKPHKEAPCARLFWQIFGRGLGESGFTRERKRAGLNHLLNYGYAVLLSATLQKCFGVGLDPTFGLFHVTRERATPLAYDLMEPFRPCVDWRVYQWARQQPAPWSVTPEFRKWVIGFTTELAEWEGTLQEVRTVLEGTVRSLRQAILLRQAGRYRPWISGNSKWAG